MEYRYKTRGVCSSEILLELDGDVVKSAKFVGGCTIKEMRSTSFLLTDLMAEMERFELSRRF